MKNKNKSKPPTTEPKLSGKSRSDASEFSTPTRTVSGSSNREGGHDLHPHPGDHGRAGKRGSNDDMEYQGLK